MRTWIDMYLSSFDFKLRQRGLFLPLWLFIIITYFGNLYLELVELLLYIFRPFGTLYIGSYFAMRCSFILRSFSPFTNVWINLEDNIFTLKLNINAFVETLLTKPTFYRIRSQADYDDVFYRPSRERLDEIYNELKAQGVECCRPHLEAKSYAWEAFLGNDNI